MTTSDTSRIESAIKDRELLEARRKTIVAAATELFTRRGYANVSVNEVASEAGVSIGSLYKYIRTKEDILWLVIDDIYDQHDKSIDITGMTFTNVTEKLAHILRSYALSVHTHRRKVLLIYREFGNLPPLAQMEFVEREKGRLKVFRDLIEDGMVTGEFVCTDPLMAATDALMVASTWVLKRYFFEGVPVDEYIERQLSLLLRSLGVPLALQTDHSGLAAP